MLLTIGIATACAVGIVGIFGGFYWMCFKIKGTHHREKVKAFAKVNNRTSIA